MRFHTEGEPKRGVAQEILPGVRRIVADNPGPMTYHGTNTYLIETADGVLLLDPGPDSPRHVQAVLGAGHGRIAHILLTHAHHDHCGALAAIRSVVDVPTYAHRNRTGTDFSPDVFLPAGATIAGMTAIHTPGHTDEHLCFALPRGVLFTGDHVMPWSTSVVSHPEGDMSAYFASLSLMLARSDKLYLSGHGPPLYQPRSYVEELLRHRQAREDTIIAQLHRSTTTVPGLTQLMYSGLAQELVAAATHNVLAHLWKLEQEGRAHSIGELWFIT